MYTLNDLVDAILESLKKGSPPAPARRRWADDPALRGRPFLSEWDIRKALGPGQGPLAVPKDAIISPLALEWLALKGIPIVRR